MVYSSRSLLAIAVTLATTNALELTSENFAEMTAGKSVFLKFYAPWCGHCKAMADDWAKLEKDFEGHDVALVASVDCTDEANEQVCTDFNIEVRRPMLGTIERWHRLVHVPNDSHKSFLTHFLFIYFVAFIAC